MSAIILQFSPRPRAEGPAVAALKAQERTERLMQTDLQARIDLAHAELLAAKTPLEQAHWWEIVKYLCAKRSRR